MTRACARTRTSATWLPQEHLAWFVIDAVSELDLSAFFADYRPDGHGRPPTTRRPHELALLIYSYATGERSSPPGASNEEAWPPAGSEWPLLAATHNLPKLHRRGLAGLAGG